MLDLAEEHEIMDVVEFTEDDVVRSALAKKPGSRRSPPTSAGSPTRLIAGRTATLTAHFLTPLRASFILAESHFVGNVTPKGTG
jgi:hypothetical protein